MSSSRALPFFPNPIWTAATTRQCDLCRGDRLARRYDPAILPFAAMPDHAPESLAALTRLVAPGEQVWLFEVPPLSTRDWRLVRSTPGCQMACERLSPNETGRPAVASSRLDPVTDGAAIQALKATAFPGLFGPRTPEMGRFRGIRVDGDLAAMAGERLAVPGAREVSAVCTHPAHTGRGYAQRLTREATAAILADGDLPILHVAGGNAAARHIYEQLGYRATGEVIFALFERLG